MTIHGPLVRVVWHDSGLHIDGWKSATKITEEAQASSPAVTTVGFLIHDDDDQTIVALSWDAANDTYYGAQVIYKTSLIEITYIVETNREAA